MNKKIALLSIVVLMSGCFAAGVPVEEQKVASFRKGQTTYAEVLDSIGSPTTQTVTSEGGKTAYWTFVEAGARPASSIPIIGPLVGGSDTNSNVLVLHFDPHGVLQDFGATSGASGVGTGLASGAYMGRVSDLRRPAESN
jgi:hypothetical protein